MSTAQHTPGPWQSQHDFDLSGEFTILGNVDGEVIDGHTYHTYTTVAEVYDNDNLSEDRANARLIAAAPELLAALEHGLHWLEGSTRVKALAAIAKARGGAA